MMFLERYRWPGNVRELRNVLERAVLLSESNQVMPSDLPASILDAPATTSVSGDFNSTKRRVILDFEVAYLRALLQQTGGNSRGPRRWRECSAPPCIACSSAMGSKPRTTAPHLPPVSHSRNAVAPA